MRVADPLEFATSNDDGYYTGEVPVSHTINLSIKTWNHSMRLFIACVFVSCLASAATFAVEPSRDAENWSRFRGPHGTGESLQANLPTKMDANSVDWVVDLPVRGHSSPIVWGDRIFLTGATTKDGVVQRHVVCCDRATGKVLWDKIAATGNGEKLHKMNSWATPSCVTDGQRVVAFFGSGGLHCFQVDGTPLWSRQLGEFPGAWGVGASPIIVDNMVIQNCDAEGTSYLLAVDKTTGQDVWRTPRQSKPKGGWSTPIVIDVDGRRELVVNGEFGVQSYNPQDGSPYWSCRSFNGRGTPSPVWGNGLLYLVNGKSGDVYAVKPGGKGDVTDSRMAWHTERRGGRDLPSPVLVDDVMMVIGMSGVATGYDAKDGRELWKERLGGNFSGSPIVADGLVYTASEGGELLVLKPGPSLELIARASVRVADDEVFRSSIGVSRGQLLLRSDRRLYCVGSK